MIAKDLIIAKDLRSYIARFSFALPKVFAIMAARRGPDVVPYHTSFAAPQKHPGAVVNSGAIGPCASAGISLLVSGHEMIKPCP